MTELPASIEAYLVEADFSGTEILILRKLLEGHAMTLREIGGKTGKSPGVLDQAMKKLVGKHIIGREMINGNPKFVLSSLDAIANWIKEDMRKKREVMKRKQEDFESFIASLKIDHSKPEIHYFYGDEGIEQAYLKLLEYGKEMLVYKPVIYKEEEDPHQDFYKKLRAERGKRGISMRVLAYDTPLGRRYQSRDMFENRKTTLISEQSYAFNFEKIIIGNTIACIDHAEKKASIIRYEELVHTERVLFDTLWNQPRVIGSAPEQKEERMLEPETLEELKEFLFSKRSVVAFVLCACIAAGVTYALYRHNVYLNTQRVREEVKAIAATGALQFDGQDLELLRTKEDIVRPEYEKVIQKLNEIRSQNASVRYAYLLRKTHDPTMLEFVADADSLNPDAVSDINHDGNIDGEDESVPPGREYPVDGDQDLLAGFNGPSANKEPFQDQWGIWISGFAPVQNDQRETVAIFGVDRDAQDIYELSQQSFHPLSVFLLVFFLLVFVRLAAFNRSLAREMVDVMKSKKVVVGIMVYLVFALVVTLGFRQYTLSIAKQRVQEKVLAIAATGVLKFQAEELSPFHQAEDARKPEYEALVHKLQDIKDQNDQIAYVYIMRPTGIPEQYAFVADSNSTDPFTLQCAGSRWENQCCH
jgi:DNA-binding Lrp family transcriptional regulator